MSALAPQWLKIFMAVAKHGSFNRAAESLLLTQPAISQKVKRLETTLGTRLFERSPSGVRLTPAGRALYRYAQAVLWLLNTAERAVSAHAQDDAGAPPRFILGSSPTIAVYCLPKWLGLFYERFPQVLVNLQTDTTPHLVNKTANHSVHLAVIEGELPYEANVDYVVLREIKFRLIVPDIPKWSTERLPISTLDGQNFIARPPDAQTRRWMERIFEQHGIHPRIVAELDTPDSILHAVRHGVGITILPLCQFQQANTKGLRAIEIEGVTLKRYIKAVWAKDIPLHPLALAFLQSLTTVFPHLREVLQRLEGAIAGLEALYKLQGL